MSLHYHRPFLLSFIGKAEAREPKTESLTSRKVVHWTEMESAKCLLSKCSEMFHVPRAPGENLPPSLKQKVMSVPTVSR